MDLKKIEINFKLGIMPIDDIKLLIETVKDQQEEIYWSDIAIEAMFKSREEWIRSHKELENMIKQYQLQETLLLGRLQKLTLEYKELKEKNRFKFVEKMLIENTELAEENAKLKGTLPV